MITSNRLFSVSELTSAIKSILEGRFPFVNVAGEISNLRRPGSGHLYFTLKDEHSRINAVLFKMQQRYLEKIPSDGQLVVCRGRISVYEPRGDYQLIVDGLDFHGAGALQLAFEQLKKKLAGEGLFDRSRKRELPPLPGWITLVTSPTGAAVHDFIRIAGKRCPRTRISVYPVSVQGEGAAAEIRLAIKEINRLLKTDIIVLCRGGGSIEDLWAFNDEQLARAIRESAIPVVSAVGHEIDYTIADFAADLRAPTPSGAAEMLLPDSAGLADHISGLAARLYSNIQSRIDNQQSRLTLYRHRLSNAGRPLDTLMLRVDQLAGSMEHAIRNSLAAAQTRLSSLDSRLQRNNPLHSLRLHGQRVQELQHRLQLAGKNIIGEQEQRLARATGLLDAVSPLSTLARGYSISRKQTGGKPILHGVDQVVVGEEIEVILHRGKMDCRVTKIHDQSTDTDKAPE